MKLTGALLTLGSICLVFYFFGELPFDRFSISESLGRIGFTQEDEKENTVLDNVIFTGDVMLARNVERLVELYGADYPYKNLSKVFASTTYQVANFEASIPEVHVPTADLTFGFSVNETQLPTLFDAGFTNVSLANNHSFDFGYQNYEHSVDALNKVGISAFGKPYKLSTSSVDYLDFNSMSVAIIGIDLTLSSYTKEELEEVFRASLDRSELQIVYVHWGTEYTYKHSSLQEKYAKLFIELGADLIIGHHPHVVQDIERYDDVLVFYSLGNFIFDQYFSKEVQEGLMLSLTLTDSPTIQLLPVTSIGSRVSPRLMTGFEKEEFLKDLAKRSDSDLSTEIKSALISL